MCVSSVAAECEAWRLAAVEDRNWCVSWACVCVEGNVCTVSNLCVGCVPAVVVDVCVGGEKEVGESAVE